MANTFYQKGKKYNCVKNGTPYFRKSAVINGKQRSFYGDGEKECLRKIEEAKLAEAKGFDYDTKNARVGDTFRRWLFDIKRLDRNIKDNTFSQYVWQYEHRFESYPIGKMKMNSLTSAALQAHLNALYETEHLSAASVSYALKPFKLFCKWAVDEGYLIKNPCGNIVLPGRKITKQEVETFTDDERKTLLHYMEGADFWYDTLIRLAFATGMRKGELLALRWQDIDGDTIHVRNTSKYYASVDSEGNRTQTRTLDSPKTASSARDIPLLKSTQDMLAAHRLAQKKYMLKHGLPQTEFVFTNTEGRQIFSSNLDGAYRRLLKSAGLPHKKFHAIRHTFATEALRRGVPVEEVSKLLGHASVTTTFIYVHATEDTKRAAIELMGEMM